MQPGLNFDLGNLRLEAKFRWLKNPEILFILQNHKYFLIEDEIPEKPISGSLFLFNRRVHKFYRKDGHTWGKKKDGRTVSEAHERLKVENVDALSCYYAHGEKNRYFQRRIYWMLNPAYDHIVLVHYREVCEGRSLPPDFQQTKEQLSSQNDISSANNIPFKRVPSAASEVYNSYQASCSSISGEANSMHLGEDVGTSWFNMLNISATSDPSSQPEVHQAFRDLEEKLGLDEYDDNVLEDIALARANNHKNLEDPAFLDGEIGISFQKFHENLDSAIEYTGCYQGLHGKPKSLPMVLHHDFKISPWNETLELRSYSTELSADGKVSSSMALTDGFEPSCYPTSATEDLRCIGNQFKQGTQFSSEEAIFDTQLGELEQISLRHVQNYADLVNGSDINSQLSASGRFFLGSDNLWSPDSVTDLIAGELCSVPSTADVGLNSEVVSVQKENDIDSTSNINIQDRNHVFTSDSLEFNYSDQGQHGTSFAPEPCLTLAKKLLFRICEISPEWSFAFERTKVIMTGEFLCNPSAYSWAVMFGEVQVPAEIIQKGVLRFEAPEHAAGKVALCITSGNKESCSEVREFEFRTKSVFSSLETSHLLNATDIPEVLSLLVKFVHLLLCRSDDFSIANGSGPREIECCRKFKAAEELCSQLGEHKTEISSFIIDSILQELIKDKFQQWLLSKTDAKKGRNCMLSKEEQQVIHMISGLSYEWALKPILNAGVGINFRDADGKTALHWAAHFGREKMTAALLAAGALPGAVTDPNPQDPMGKTAGAIAAASGHNGLAGYLSEAELTSHLFSINGWAAEEDEKAVESISERKPLLQVGETEEELSLKDYLAGVRNSAQAAAQIQAAFRSYSLRMRREKAAMNRDEYGMTSDELLSLTSSAKIQRALHSYPDQKFDKAALSIQKKYRGWKGRKAFLTFRQSVLKIQAHVRGHQVRKKYLEIIWAVSMLEKLVLRWKKGGVGLRTFQLESNLANEEEEEEDIIKVFRKQKVYAALEHAFSRVRSMVKSPSARQQYRRMLQCYCIAKAEQASADDATPELNQNDNFELMQDEDVLSWFQEDQVLDQR